MLLKFEVSFIASNVSYLDFSGIEGSSLVTSRPRQDICFAVDGEVVDCGIHGLGESGCLGHCDVWSIGPFKPELLLFVQSLFAVLDSN